MVRANTSNDESVCLTPCASVCLSLWLIAYGINISHRFPQPPSALLGVKLIQFFCLVLTHDANHIGTIVKKQQRLVIASITALKERKTVISLLVLNTGRNDNMMLHHYRVVSVTDKRNSRMNALFNRRLSLEDLNMTTSKSTRLLSR